LVEARCPVCGKLYNITDSRNRGAVEGHFLKHKDNCRLPEPGEFIRIESMVVRVLSVDRESEDFPMVEVVFPSGRRGIYMMANVGGVRDQGKAAERYCSKGGKVES
jgi:hypothetical protein